MSEHDRELREWFDALIDGTIDERAHRALADRLDADEAARRAFVEHIELHAALNWEHAEPLAEPANDAAVVGRITPEGSRTRRIGWAIAAAVCVAGVVAAIAVAVLSPATHDHPKRPPVAVLMGERGVRWTSEPQQVGEGVSPQRLAIESGVLEMQFNSGAAMAMRGPGAMTLIDAMRCRLDYGTVTVHAPRSAAGFTVASATFDAVDLGTGFGVRRGVDGDGAGELHVFEGSVELRPANGVKRTLTAGQAAAIDAAGAVRDVPIDVFAFPPTADDPTPRWADFADRLKLDPSLLMHVTANRVGDAAAASDRSKANVAVRTLSGKSAADRFGSDRAIAFAGSDDGLAFDLPGVHPAFTLAMWVKLDRLPPSVVAALIQTEGWDTDEVHWNIGNGGAMTLGVRGGVMLIAPDALSEAHVGRWTHLAATYDAPTGAMALYINGERVAERVHVHSRPFRFGPSRIGNWNQSPRPLAGSVDDVMVMSRALDADSIRTLFEAGELP